MSNEKLSELSKPVDFLKSATLITARNFERWSKLAALTSESSSVLHSITLLETSQLLSALLAELEAKDKRIAELEAKLNHYVAVEHARASFDQTADIIKRADDAEREASELRTKLATPVRLPERWDISGQVNPPRIVQVQFEQQNRTLVQCADAIRAAGFTVGDE